MEQKTFIQITGKDIKSNLANLTHLVFEVTDACNLKCNYCGYGELYNTYDKRNNSFMNFSMAKKVIDYLYAIWQKYPGKSSPRNIVFGFYGEGTSDELYIDSGSNLISGNTSAHT